MNTYIFFLGISNSIILTMLGLIHLYWAIGGKGGLEKTLPTNVDGKKILNPKKIDCILAGVFLIAFAVVYLSKIQVVTFLPIKIAYYSSWAITIIFLVRAIGDFRYVGFTKRIKTTAFARMDTKLYSPLCLLIGLSGVLVSYFF